MGMKNFNNNVYDPIEVYSNSEQFVFNNNNDNNNNNKPRLAHIPDLIGKGFLLTIPLDNDFDYL